MLGHQFPEHVRRKSVISARSWPSMSCSSAKLRPVAVDFAASNNAAHDEHDIGVAMIGPAVAVLFCGAPKLGHGNQRDVFHKGLSDKLVPR